jgi:hypothetical protein
MCVVGCRCVILDICFTGIENGKPKCIVNYETDYDDDLLVLGRHSSVKRKAFFFSVCISSELLKLLEWKKRFASECHEAGPFLLFNQVY